jgi:hypothetical protein
MPLLLLLLLLLLSSRPKRATLATSLPHYLQRGRLRHATCSPSPERVQVPPPFHMEIQRCSDCNAALFYTDNLLSNAHIPPQ